MSTSVEINYPATGERDYPLRAKEMMWCRSQNVALQGLLRWPVHRARSDLWGGFWALFYFGRQKRHHNPSQSPFVALRWHWPE